MNKRISDLLKRLGIPASLLGYKYTKLTVSKILAGKYHVIPITSLFTEVAAECGTTYTRVERGVRHAIESGISRTDVMDVWDEIFLGSYSALKGKPTNKEFIATLVDYLRERG